ncbi:VWA domain-containing protein [Streptomyces sp. STCH 565 A]|uniref:VWA domain-containing protein n=1 Tax=Streptomyces sp. STCH 565 A TaxID=2950532 RepID=UPI002076390B|nr:VWA domain-containing protein [Streptomyces sp. STCH 565 A]MCM8548948.1 VWA domain-containing protein [Streptomyces sp. STCH 565 A]
MLSLNKVEVQAPGLVNLAKTAAVSLNKHGLTGQRAAVYLVVDRSYSMHPYYADGSVQHLADQALGLSVNLDDDGIVPLVFFDTRPYPVVGIHLGDHEGVVADQHRLFGGDHTMGGTHYAAAMQTVVDHYAGAASTDPALVIFQTDGAPQDADVAAQLLTRYAKRPLFFAFVGFGPRPVPFLQRLDTLAGRVVDNASYFHAGALPRSVSDSALYDGITGEFAQWLPAARAAGVL